MTIKKSVRKLVDSGVRRSVLGGATVHKTNPLLLNKALREIPPDPDATPVGLKDPITMEVLTTTTVTIPVPPGATDVDVEVIQSYKLTDANGSVFNVTISGYP